MGQLDGLVRGLREDAGITQEELAERSGLSVRTVSDVERGLRKRLYQDTAERLADALALSDQERVQFIDVARGRTAEAPRQLDRQFRRRFVAWHVDRVASLADRVGNEKDWFAVLDAEAANLTVALRWADEAGDAESVLLLGSGLFRYWQARGSLDVGRRWLERGLGMDPPASTLTSISALWGLAWLAMQQGDDAAAEDAARDLAELVRQVDDPIARRNAATVSGMVALEREDVPTALAEFDDALLLARALDDAWLLATSLLNLGVAHIAAARTAEARRLIGQALRAYAVLGDERFRARSLGYIGLAALVDRDVERAEALYHQSLVLFDEMGETKGIAEALTGLATAAAIRGMPTRTAELSGAAQRIRESFAGRALPVERRVADAAITSAKGQCDEDSWTASWTRGRALRLDEAVTQALERGGRRSRADTAAPG